MTGTEDNVEPVPGRSLNGLVDRALAGNQNLRVRPRGSISTRSGDDASRIVSCRRSGRRAARGRTSANRPLANIRAQSSHRAERFRGWASVSYEVDLFGRVRREVEARGVRTASAGGLRKHAAHLTAQLATDYFACGSWTRKSRWCAIACNCRRCPAVHRITAYLDLPRIGFGAAAGAGRFQRHPTGTARESKGSIRACHRHAGGTPAPGFAIAPALRLVAAGDPVDCRRISCSAADVASAERSMAAQCAHRVAAQPTIPA